jgi:hypothetical protein
LIEGSRKPFQTWPACNLTAATGGAHLQRGRARKRPEEKTVEEPQADTEMVRRFTICSAMTEALMTCVTDKHLRAHA